MPQTKLEAALDCARRGLPVFPLKEYVAPPEKSPDALKAAIRRAKEPRSEMTEFYDRATTDPVTIQRWWTQWPKSNIGISTDKLLVVDLDYAKGADASWQRLSLLYDWPDTLKTKTWSGGAHILMRLPEGVQIDNSVSDLGPGVDVRSHHGYVVAPGSEIAGKRYEFENDRPIELAPADVMSECKRVKPRSESAGKRVVEEDKTARKLCAKYLVERSPEADEGVRDATAVAVANRFYDFGVEQLTCFGYLCEWNERKCNPPLDESVLRRISRSAMKTRQNPIGCDHPAAGGFEAVPIEEQITPNSAPAAEIPKPILAKNHLYFVPFHQSVASALESSAEPLIEGLLDCGTMTVVYGESGSGKSFSETDQGFHIAAGLPWAGMAVKQGVVVYVAAEGGQGIHRRMAAMAKHYGRDDVPLFVVPCPVDLLRANADVKPLIDMIRAIETQHGKVVKVTIDTLSRAMAGGDENSPIDMGVLVKHFDLIRTTLDTNVTIVHHTGKDKARGARGHSLLRAATDTEIEVQKGLITVTKQRDMEDGKSLMFKLMPVRLGVDVRGREVKSCYVEVRQKKPGEKFIIDLEGEVSAFAAAIKRKLDAPRRKKSETEKYQSFKTGEAIKWWGAMSDMQTMQTPGFRNAVGNFLNKMHGSGWLEKGKRGQWLWVNASNA